eukprot:8264647-Prorocentrum_lima.AAC.1
MSTQRNKTSSMMYLGSQSQPREIKDGTWSWSECLGQQCAESLCGEALLQIKVVIILGRG